MTRYIVLNHNIYSYIQRFAILYALYIQYPIIFNHLYVFSEFPYNVIHIVSLIYFQNSNSNQSLVYIRSLHITYICVYLPAVHVKRAKRLYYVHVQVLNAHHTRHMRIQHFI